MPSRISIFAVSALAFSVFPTWRIAIVQKLSLWWKEQVSKNMIQGLLILRPGAQPEGFSRATKFIWGGGENEILQEIQKGCKIFADKSLTTVFQK